MRIAVDFIKQNPTLFPGNIWGIIEAYGYIKNEFAYIHKNHLSDGVPVGFHKYNKDQQVKAEASKKHMLVLGDQILDDPVLESIRVQYIEDKKKLGSGCKGCQLGDLNRKYTNLAREHLNSNIPSIGT